MADETVYVPEHGASFQLSHTRGRDLGDRFLTVAEAIARDPVYYRDEAFPSAEDKASCIDQGTIWTARWASPDSDGFYVAHASSLERLCETLRAFDAEATAA